MERWSPSSRCGSAASSLASSGLFISDIESKINETNYQDGDRVIEDYARTGSVTTTSVPDDMTKSRLEEIVKENRMPLRTSIGAEGNGLSNTLDSQARTVDMVSVITEDLREAIQQAVGSPLGRGERLKNSNEDATLFDTEAEKNLKYQWNTPSSVRVISNNGTDQAFSPRELALLEELEKLKVALRASQERECIAIAQR